MFLFWAAWRAILLLVADMLQTCCGLLRLVAACCRHVAACCGLLRLVADMLRLVAACCRHVAACCGLLQTCCGLLLTCSGQVGSVHITKGCSMRHTLLHVQGPFGSWIHLVPLPGLTRRFLTSMDGIALHRSASLLCSCLGCLVFYSCLGAGDFDIHSPSFWEDHFSEHVCCCHSLLMRWMWGVHLLHLQEDLYQAVEECLQVSGHHLPGTNFCINMYSAWNWQHEKTGHEVWATPEDEGHPRKPRGGTSQGTWRPWRRQDHPIISFQGNLFVFTFTQKREGEEGPSSSCLHCLSSLDLSCCAAMIGFAHPTKASWSPKKKNESQKWHAN